MSTEPLYTLSGTVRRGAGRGNTLGFPTANLALRAPYPPCGVYVSRVRVPGGERLEGLTNIGVHPTFGALPEPVAESYLFGAERTLYGESIEVDLLFFLRTEEHFASPEALIRQLQRDIESAKEWFQEKSAP